MYIWNKCKEFKFKKFKLLTHAATISKIVKFVAWNSKLDIYSLNKVSQKCAASMVCLKYMLNLQEKHNLPLPSIILLSKIT